MLYEFDYSMLERHRTLCAVLYWWVVCTLCCMRSAAGHSSVLFAVDGRWKSAVNCLNPLGTKGNLVHAFSSILHDLWHGEMPYISPFQFRVRTTCLSIRVQGLIPFTLVLAFHLHACWAIWRFGATRFTGILEFLT